MTKSCQMHRLRASAGEVPKGSRQDAPPSYAVTGMSLKERTLPRLWRTTHKWSSSNMASVLMCSLAVNSGSLRTTSMLGKDNSTTTPSPVLHAKMRRPARMTSCVNLNTHALVVCKGCACKPMCPKAVMRAETEPGTSERASPHARRRSLSSAQFCFGPHRSTESARIALQEARGGRTHEEGRGLRSISTPSGRDRCSSDSSAVAGLQLCGLETTQTDVSPLLIFSSPGKVP